MDKLRMIKLLTMITENLMRIAKQPQDLLALEDRINLELYVVALITLRDYDALVYGNDKLKTSADQIVDDIAVLAASKAAAAKEGKLVMFVPK